LAPDLSGKCCPSAFSASQISLFRKDESMGALITLVAAVCGIASLVCFILVVVKMFQKGETGIGIACIVGIFLCGIGGIVAFVYGWIKSGEWQLQKIMLVWTACIVVNILLQIVGVAMGVSMMPTAG
jgi:hypothetical protein